MKPLEYCEQFNNKMVQLNLPENMTLVDGDMEDKVVFNITGDVAGFF